MFNEIVVNVHPFETRVAIIENNKLVELFVENKKNEDIVGNIYKGRVKDVLPGMGASFIELGLNRTAFLPYNEILLDFDSRREAEKELKVKNIKNSANISKLLKSGDEIVVQIKKGPIGKKGARITQQLSIPGKFLVFFPFDSKVAISRKIRDNNEKKRIKEIINSIKKDDYGIIARTDVQGKSKEEIEQEYHYLRNTWYHLKKEIKHATSPYCIFDQNQLANFLIRDLFSSKVNRMVVDDKSFYRNVRKQLKDIAPELAKRTEYYHEDSPVFDAYGIEKEIDTIFNSRIYLPSGGNIVIEQTEALVSIDINTGSFVGGKKYSDTIRRTNVEAAEEVARQIRLRDLSGITIIDFIDMKSEKDKQEVLSTLKNALRNDRAMNKIYSFNQLGLVHITRKRTRSKPIEKYSDTCPVCNGSGRILSKESITMEIIRWLHRSEYIIAEKPIRVETTKRVCEYLKKHKDEYLANFEGNIELAVDEELKHEDFKVYLSKGNKEVTDKY
ncbi:MAG: Rne/Rng family ribonuclease [Candidatus Cloacimonadota bacterium]|nr:Rne/Rng family ribonuclease [Candidatus Cloacimonadota bacterium]